MVDCDLVVATLSTSRCLTQLLKPGHFTHILLDEAAQVIWGIFVRGWRRREGGKIGKKGNWGKKAERGKNWIKIGGKKLRKYSKRSKTWERKIGTKKNGKRRG